MIGGAIFRELENNGIQEVIDKNKRQRTESEVKIEQLREHFSVALNVSVNQTLFNKLVADIRNIAIPSDPSLMTYLEAGQFSWTIVTTIGKPFKFHATHCCREIHQLQVPST